MVWDAAQASQIVTKPCPDNFTGEQSKLGFKDQESIQSGTTPDASYQWESDKLTVRHHKREPRGQPFPSR